VLQALVITLFLLSAISLLIVPLSRPLTGFSLLLLCTIAWRTWSLRCELGGERVMLVWDGEGRWWWRQNHVERELNLAGDSYLSSWLIVLNLYEPLTKRGYSMLLFPSSLGAERFRRLTVRLRLEGRATVLGAEDSTDVK